MKNVSWDDLRLFHQVAKHGGLTAAAKVTACSVPTIGRRMLSLEQQTGQTLFERTQTGYSLTSAGEALYERVKVMYAASKPAEAFLNAQKDKPLIRLSTGTSTAAFLADRFSALVQPQDAFTLSIVTTETMLDIAHRQVDLGIRNKPAEALNLASRQLGDVSFAAYYSRSVTNPDSLNWIAMDEEHANYPAARWVHQNGYETAIYANTVSTVQRLVKAGAGKAVMPCMIGDWDPDFVRARPVIEELTNAQYLVMHNDDRHRAPIRRLIERIVDIYQRHSALLSGQLRSAGNV